MELSLQFVSLSLLVLLATILVRRIQVQFFGSSLGVEESFNYLGLLLVAQLTFQLLFLLYVSFSCNEKTKRTSNPLLILLIAMSTLLILFDYSLLSLLPLLMFFPIMITLLSNKC